jgi:hypothetical protein
MHVGSISTLKLLSASNPSTELIQKHLKRPKIHFNKIGMPDEESLYHLRSDFIDDM